MAKPHHGRRGGRLVEVISALMMVVLSVALFGAVFAGMMYLFLRFVPYATGGLIFLAMMAFSQYLFPWAMTATWWVLRHLWGPYLQYYKYEPHSLRPIIPQKGSDE